MSNKEYLHIYNQLQTQLLTDIDMSGSLYIEYEKTEK